MGMLKKFTNIHSFRMQLCYTEVVIKRFRSKHKSVSTNYLIENNKETYDKLVAATDMSNEDWRHVRSSILKTNSVHTNLVDSVIIDMCKIAGNIEGALSYYKFLESDSHNIHVAISRKYLQFLTLKKDSITESEKADIVRLYDDIKTKYPNFDRELCQSCIIALSLTDRWKEAYKLWKTYKTTHTLVSSAYSHIAAAAFANNNEIIGWEVLEAAALTNRTLQPFIYVSYLEFCKRETETFNINIEKMFDFWRRSNYIVLEEVVSKYMDACNEFGWKAMYTDVKLEQCEKCSQNLLDVKLSDANFEMLSNAVMNSVIINKDVYWKSSPEEIERFKLFVERHKPFDVVIDGLNVSYVSRNNNPKSLGMLPKVVRRFSNEGKVILILGRKHMNKSPIMKNLRSSAFIFLVNDLSQDDPFLLYATLASGRHCNFVSIDLMRENKFLIDDPAMRSMFHQWQVSHQYTVCYDATTDKMQLKEPLKCQLNVQNTGLSWHIPYVLSEIAQAQSKEIYELPENWACFRKPK